MNDFLNWLVCGYLQKPSPFQSLISRVTVLLTLARPNPLPKRRICSGPHACARFFFFFFFCFTNCEIHLLGIIKTSRASLWAYQPHSGLGATALVAPRKKKKKIIYEPPALGRGKRKRKRKRVRFDDEESREGMGCVCWEEWRWGLEKIFSAWVGIKHG